MKNKTMLAPVFADLSEYVISQDKKVIVFQFPIGAIELNRDLILAQFSDAEITHKRGNPYETIKCFY